MAAQKGNITAVQLLLQCNETDINTNLFFVELGWHYTPLILASRNGHSDVVKLLLEQPHIDVKAVLRDGFCALHMASIEGHTEVVKLLLDHPKTDVNQAIPDHAIGAGRTSIWFASDHNYPEVVKVLADHPKTDINTWSFWGFTPPALYQASSMGHSDVVKVLLSHPHTDVNWVNRATHECKKCTPLLVASKAEYSEIVMLLLDHPQIDVTYVESVIYTYDKALDKQAQLEIGSLVFGRSISALNKDEELLVAAIIGNLTQVSLVLEDIQTNINVVDRGGRTPLIWASKNGKSKVVELLLNNPLLHVDQERLLKDATSALLLASFNGHFEVVKQLLGVPNMDVNQVDSGGRTSLYKACQNGHLKVVEELLKHDEIDKNKAEPELGQTPFYMASKNGHLGVVSCLLRYSELNVNKATINRETPLMIGAAGGYSDIVEIILAHSTIDVNFVAFGGKTVVFYAFYASYANVDDQRDIVELLMRCPSIDMNIKDDEGKTTSDYVEVTSRTDIEQIFDSKDTLRKKGHTCCSARVNDGLQIAAEKGNLTMVRSFLLCPQVDLNNGYKYGRTPLYMASMKKHVEVVKTLLADIRTNVNMVVNSGNALSIAAENEHPEIVRLLLNHSNIYVNQVNTRNKKTALHVASETGHVEIAEMLLKNPQIFVNEQDLYGKSALDLASTRGFLRVVKLLLRCPKLKVASDGVHGKEIDEAVALRSVLLSLDVTCCLNVKSGLLAAAWENDYRALRGLLQCPESDINSVDERGRTPLYISALKGHIQSVQVLLNDPNVDNNVDLTRRGGTPFSIASEKLHSEILRQLIEHGKTDVNKGWNKDMWETDMQISKLSTNQDAETTLLSITSTTGQLMILCII